MREAAKGVKRGIKGKYATNIFWQTLILMIRYCLLDHYHLYHQLCTTHELCAVY